MRTTFCCCIPTRLGVLILAPLVAICAFINGYSQIYLLVNFGSRYTGLAKALRGIMAAVAILTAIAACFGFIGAGYRRRRMVAFFGHMLLASLLLLCVFGSLNVWQIFQNRNAFTQQCMSNSNFRSVEQESFFSISFSGSGDSSCRGLAQANAWVSLVLFVILVLVQVWCISIVYKYVAQLRDEEMKKTAEPQGQFVQQNNTYVQAQPLYGNVAHQEGNHSASSTPEKQIANPYVASNVA